MCIRDRLKTSAEEFIIDEEPQGEPMVTVYLETQDGNTKQTVEFYKSEGKKTLIDVYKRQLLRTGTLKVFTKRSLTLLLNLK